MPTPLNLSASRAGAILGMSNYSTPLQVWLQIMESREPGFCEKNNYKIPEFEYNSAMKWGHAFESAVVELSEEKSNKKIINREKIFAYSLATGKTISFEADTREHEGIPLSMWLSLNGYNITCHQDGEYENDDDLHEGKTTSINYYYTAFGKPETDQVPMDYQLQAQHQLICRPDKKRVKLSVIVFPKRVEEWEAMGWTVEKFEDDYCLKHEKYRNVFPMEWAYVLSMQGYFQQYVITAHPDLQKLMLEAYSDFWNNHVLTGTPPEPMNYDDIRSICREPVGTIISTPEIENLISEYKQIGSEISSTGTLAKRREQLKTQILNFSRTAGFTEDDESRDKWIIRGQDGKKLASYGRDKNNNFIFR